MNLNGFVTGIQHVGISAKDIEATIAFYTGLGFKLKLRTQNDRSKEKVAFLQLKNLTIEAYECSSPKSNAGAVDHFALDTADIETVYQQLQKAGYRFESPGILSLPFWEKGIRYFIIIGPNQEKIEFCQML
ncbi:VOC family protein [Caproicibacter sp.]|uniref:VOC family protein n=1 Tax=Caproicibacter sp. TaxID=2814884 RepID=UPI0039895B42